MLIVALENFMLFFLEKISMITIGLLVVIFTVYAIYLYRTYSDMPPGPWGIPFFGYSLFLSKEPYNDFIKIGKKYGDVFSIGIGTKCCIILNNYKTIKDGFTKSGGALDGRQKDGFATEFGENKMMGFTDGEIWRNQRRFLLSAMKDYRLDKLQIEQNIHKLAENAVGMILEKKGQPFDLGTLTYSITANVIAYSILGHLFSDKDQHVVRAIKNVDELVNSFSFTSPVNALAGIMAYLPHKLTGINVIFESRKTLYDFIDKLVTEHKETFDENHMRDLIDVYLMKLKSTSQNGLDGHEIYTTPYLRANVTSLFLAGSESSSTLLTWSFKILAAHPKIQKRLQNEIDNVVGYDRHPVMEDLIRMPYTEAVMLEIQRYTSISPLTPIAHRVTHDVKLNGYRIPKDSIAIANFWSVHYDPELWKNPEVFDPERFLDENGIIGKLKEYVMTFSVGKRRCIGEDLARIEFFLVLTAIAQKVTFFLPKGEKWPFQMKIHVPIRKCNQNHICAVQRDNN